MAAYYPSSTESGRWTIASEHTGPNKAQALDMGLTLKRNGRLRRYYDAQGMLRMAYSYNTCILAWTEPSEDYPQGRAVLNLTRYSMTSNRHVSEIIAEVARQGGAGHYPWWRFEYTLKDAPMVLRSAMDLTEIPEESTHEYLSSVERREMMYRYIMAQHASDVVARNARRAEQRADRHVAKLRARGLTLIQGGVR